MRQVYEIFEQPFVDDDVEYVSPITARIAVTNTGSMLLVRGPLTTTILLECGRCLEPVRLPISVNLEEDFDLQVIDDKIHHDQKVEIVEEDSGGVFEGKVLCLDVLIRQAALLETPLQPLCRVDCPGIPVKGQEFDAEPATDSPFKDLSKYFDESA